ncbi:hypothetical protein KKB99_01485 [bacterium]|nr:hypothetical protein [bacterium]MBU1024658.1 hypothetical protein [bacterium]
MNLRKIRISVIIYLFTSLLISAVICGCTQKKKSIDQSVDLKNSSSTLTENAARNEKQESPENAVIIPHYNLAFSPLTYQKFTDIQNDIAEFSAVHIYYHSDTNYLPQGTPLDIRQLDLSAGERGINRYFTTIDQYKGNYYHYLDFSDPPERIKRGMDFTPAQLESIYNYLDADQNRIDYFFSSDEFEGLDDLMIHLPHTLWTGILASLWFFSNQTVIITLGQ